MKHELPPVIPWRRRVEHCSDYCRRTPDELIGDNGNARSVEGEFESTEDKRKSQNEKRSNESRSGVSCCEKEPVQRCKQKKASCHQDDHLRAFGESAYEYAEGKHGRGNQGRNRVKRQSTHGALPRCAAASDQRSNRFVQNVSQCRRYRCEVGNLHEGFRNGAVMAAVEDSRDRVPRMHLRGHIFDVAVIACDE